MHFNALRGLTQFCLTAHWIWHNTPMIQGILPSSANQCTVVKIHLRFNQWSKYRNKLLTCLRIHLYQTQQTPVVSRQLCWVGSAIVCYAADWVLPVMIVWMTICCLHSMYNHTCDWYCCSLLLMLSLRISRGRNANLQMTQSWISDSFCFAS